MAGISAKAIKSKIKSMESTRQITKAMQLVATSKLRGAQERAINNRKYFGTLFDAMGSIATTTPGFSTPFLKEGQGKPLYFVIAGDRGLAGGYNNNIFKLAMANIPEDAAVIPIGKKAVEYFRRRPFELVMESLDSTESISASDCFSVAKVAADGFINKRFSKVFIIYTRIDSMLAQTPLLETVLPLSDLKAAEGEKSRTLMILEGGEELFNRIVPEYMAGLLYSAVKESFASEQAARRTAMDSASKNADEMIASYELQFNRARQAAITQEITEIVAGSES